MTFVVAGSARQFDAWCREQVPPIAPQSRSSQRKALVYVRDVEVLRGYRFDPTTDRVEWVGTFWDREDIGDVRAGLRVIGWEDA